MSSELEYHQDKINEHMIWSSVQDKTVSPGDRDDFESEMQSMIDSLKTDLSRLEDTLADALTQIDDSIPRCAKCNEPIDAEECEDGVCLDCEEPDEDDEHEQHILWS